METQEESSPIKVKKNAQKAVCCLDRPFLNYFEKEGRRVWFSDPTDWTYLKAEPSF